MKKYFLAILWFGIFSSFCFSQDFTELDSIWGIWSPNSKEKPFRIVTLETGSYYTSGPYVLEKDRIIIQPQNLSMHIDYPHISGNGWNERILDFFKTNDGYHLLIEHSPGSSTFYEGRNFAPVLYRLIIKVHFINENDMWLEIQKFNGENILYFEDGKETLYWREKVK